MAYGSRDYIFAVNLWTFTQWFIIHKEDHISYHLQAEAYFVHWSIFGHHKSKWNPLLHVKALVAGASPPSTIHAASVTHRGCLGREGEVPPAKSSAINSPCWWIPSRELKYPTWRIRKSSSKSALLGDIFLPRRVFHFWMWLKPGLWCGTPSCIQSFDPTTSSACTITHLQNKVGKGKVQVSFDHATRCCKVCPPGCPDATEPTRRRGANPIRWSRPHGIFAPRHSLHPEAFHHFPARCGAGQQQFSTSCPTKYGQAQAVPPQFCDPEGLDTFDQIPYHIGETAAAPTVPTGMKAPLAWRQRPKLLGSWYFMGFLYGNHVAWSVNPNCSAPDKAHSAAGITSWNFHLCEKTTLSSHEH